MERQNITLPLRKRMEKTKIKVTMTEQHRYLFMKIFVDEHPTPSFTAGLGHKM